MRTKIITLDVNGNATTEIGATSVIGGVFGGTGDLANPFNDNQKFGAPTLGALNWSNASQVQLLFNAIEPGNASKAKINIESLTLTFYNGVGAVGSISTNAKIEFVSGNPGNGNAGYVIGVSSDEGADSSTAPFSIWLDRVLSKIGISASLSDVDAGADSFDANCHAIASAVPEPSTWAMLILGFVGIGFMAYRRTSVTA